MTAAHETPQEEYRRERAPCSPEFQAELTRITGDIGDPVAKLRYLRGAIGEDVKSPVNWLPCAPARRAWYRFRGLEALDAVADTGTAASIGRETLAARRKARRGRRPCDRAALRTRVACGSRLADGFAGHELRGGFASNCRAKARSTRESVGSAPRTAE